MSLTRRLLKDMELNDEAIERIIAAHAATVDALREEQRAAVTAAQNESSAECEALRTAADEHRQEAERIRQEYDAFRRATEAAQTAQAREQALCAALRRSGANELAVPLLAKAVSTTEADWDGAALRDEHAALEGVLTQYSAFFAQPVPLPTDRISPPLDSSRLTREDVRCMSAEEINRNWSQVCSALHQTN